MPRDESSASQRVTFIGPGSKIYHRDPRCPALRKDNRYWPVSRGFVNERGAILADDGRVYEGRRVCRRCS